MTTGSVGRGTVLAGRYRLEDLLAESEGARFWRATDTVLARSVAIHAVSSDDPRAPGLVEAARVSATVSDPHLLRVLDCDGEGDITWVVNEWGDGISLDLMLQQGTLPADRAAWLVREVAEAIAAGHAQGVAHGRLNPEAVLVTHAGAVKLIGYVVDASLQTQRPADPSYGDLDEREADVINLAGILYAALTGRWPGVAPSSVPPAPREGRGPLRPRQVRAGVPRTLDAICDRVLNKEASRHVLPIETAHEIAAALSDHVGDPAHAAPSAALGLLHEPTVAIRVPSEPSEPSEAPEASEAEESPGSDERTEAISLAPAVDPDATQLYATPSDSPDSLAPLHPPVEPGPPPPPFEDIPERPLFATTERKVPAARAGAAAAHDAPHDAPHDAGHDAGHDAAARTGATPAHRADERTEHTGQQDFWPFSGEPADPSEVHTGTEGRGWLRTAVVIGVLLVLVVAMAIAFNQGRQSGTEPGGSSDPARSEGPAEGSPLELAAVTDFDPESEDPQENPEDAPNAIDGDPATSWTTSTYYNDPALGGLKSGVGLMVDLGGEQEPSSVTVRFKGAPTSFEVYAASTGVTQSPETIDQLDKVAERAGAPAQATVRLDPAPRTRFLLIWLTRLPAVPGGFRGEIAEISVRS